jgi:DNA-binding IclR family transcriptional regulator
LSHRHSHDFPTALRILRYIQRSRGSFEVLAESLSIDDRTLKLWLLTLVAEGYLGKTKDSRREYFVTKKGLQELRFHIEA